MNNNLAKKVSSFLIKVRKQKNISQQELANLAGLSRNFISDVELEKKVSHWIHWKKY
ncbi:helix-turn-helix domain-containing protein [Campylobacter sp.]|uniref:helix-turn-helix domain-containing protein n=1 Tax=Campylobacter sp. TaxID=205 RepID=UPI0026F9AC5F|nr:helix-turn-helix domain-containing protein [Campylobacter sp.]